jgi:hypothetical protein
MKKLLVAGFLVAIAVSGAAAFAAVSSSAKVPKCSRKLCEDVGCAADFYCASGAHVESCAEICNGH